MKIRFTMLGLWLACAMLPAVAEPAAGAADRGPLVNWTTAERRVVRARFIRLGEDSVTLELADGVRRDVKLERLSADSRKQVEVEAERAAERQIAWLRGMRFVRIRPGRFTMGSPPDEPGRLTRGMGRVPIANPAQPNMPASDLEPERQVTIRRAFWIKVTEVTWKEWCAVRERARGAGYSDIGTGRNGFRGDPRLGNHPVTEVSWLDAVKWCNLKSQLEGKRAAYYTKPDFGDGHVFLTGNGEVFVDWEAPGYRLPTEAEWEYACRQGRDSANRAFHSGAITKPDIVPPDPKLAEVGWYAGNSGGNTHPVGGRQENAFGLHDMHGNVAEWCWDWTDWLTDEDAEDPRGAAKGLYRVFRGGSWADPARCCRAAYRGTLSPLAPASCLIGFRPVCGSDPAQAE